MLALLHYGADGHDHTLREIIEALGTKMNVTAKERKELLSSGQQPIIDNRVAWANTYLKKAGCPLCSRESSEHHVLNVNCSHHKGGLCP